MPLIRGTKSSKGIACFPDVKSIPERVELAAVLVGAPKVLGVLEECAAAGVRVAVVMTSGFGELGPEGRALEVQMKELADRSGMRIVGPNSAGFMNPRTSTIIALMTTATRPCAETVRSAWWHRAEPHAARHSASAKIMGSDSPWRRRRGMKQTSMLPHSSTCLCGTRRRRSC